MKRHLTGNWYLRKKLFGGYDVIVEVLVYYIDRMGDPSPVMEDWQVATRQDLADLNIKVNRIIN